MTHVIIELSDAWDKALDHALFLLRASHPDETDEQLLARVLTDGIGHIIDTTERRHRITLVDCKGAE